MQALINVGASLRVDISEDPPLSIYKPSPINPYSCHQEELEEEGEGEEFNHNEEKEEQTKMWFEKGYARVYVRGTDRPYVAPQTFFEDVLDHDNVSEEDLADFAEKFECNRNDVYSIFDLFHSVRFSMDLGASEYDRGESLHPDALHLFQSEDYDQVPQQTWIHTKNIRAIEVPTRIWNLYEMMMDARIARMEREDLKNVVGKYTSKRSASNKSKKQRK